VKTKNQKLYRGVKVGKYWQGEHPFKRCNNSDDERAVKQHLKKSIAHWIKLVRPPAEAQKLCCYSVEEFRRNFPNLRSGVSWGRVEVYCELLAEIQSQRSAAVDRWLARR
jgi:uncharacterized protein YaeQ